MTYSVIIGRQYCPKCDTVRVVVRHPDVTEMACPVCGTVTTEAAGPDDKRLAR
jgi:ribosomal protein S27E